MIRETQRRALNGLLFLPVPFALLGLEVWAFVREVQAIKGGGGSPVALIAVCLAVLGTLLAFRGFFVVNPNQARVLQLFGDYRGTVRTPGLRFANPFCVRRAVSLRVRNFESQKLKVNDHVGNPIEIATIVVWRVVDTAQALFQVDDYAQFVHVQSEAALRNLSTRYAYDSYVEGEHSLRSHTSEIAEELKKEVQGRLAEAGVEILEARISHLAYAPEIASEMLRRQQASAIVAARQKIVEGAVGMVEMALDLLSRKKVIDLDEERKAAMVSNLLVVLCGDRPAHPVVNAGTLYS
ncbi:MAG TPA: SPFH domain-containing protein [Planctomycetota bacterium]|nr:SPFH domain-containing protein [Planctomycetota bacterium]